MHSTELVKSGSLHHAKVITRAMSLVPLGSPHVAGLNRRPYFACRSAMHKHIQHLASNCESTCTLRTHTHTDTHKPYVCCHRRSEQEVEEAHLQRALTDRLNTGLMPSSSLCAKGEADTANFAGDFYHIMGGGGQSRLGPLHNHAQPRTRANSRSHVHRGPFPHNVNTCMPPPTNFRHASHVNGPACRRRRAVPKVTTL